MRTDEVKEVKVGEYEPVANGNFVTVEFPEPQYGLSAARGITQLLEALGRGAVPATATKAETKAPAATKASAGDTGDTGKTAKTGDVTDARKGASGT